MPLPPLNILTRRSTPGGRRSVRLNEDPKQRRYGFERCLTPASDRRRYRTKTATQICWGPLTNNQDEGTSVRVDDHVEATTLGSKLSKGPNQGQTRVACNKVHKHEEHACIRVERLQDDRTEGCANRYHSLLARCSVLLARTMARPASMHEPKANGWLL